MAVSKFIQTRQVLSDEGLPELDITWRDSLNLISVTPASNNCFIIPKNKYPSKETCRMDCF